MSPLSYTAIIESWASVVDTLSYTAIIESWASVVDTQSFVWIIVLLAVYGLLAWSWFSTKNALRENTALLARTLVEIRENNNAFDARVKSLEERVATIHNTDDRAFLPINATPKPAASTTPTMVRATSNKRRSDEIEDADDFAAYRAAARATLAAQNAAYHAKFSARKAEIRDALGSDREKIEAALARVDFYFDDAIEYALQFEFDEPATPKSAVSRAPSPRKLSPMRRADIPKFDLSDADE